jgi:hypothetical protein
MDEQMTEPEVTLRSLDDLVDLSRKLVRSAAAGFDCKLFSVDHRVLRFSRIRADLSRTESRKNLFPAILAPTEHKAHYQTLA